MTKEEQEWTFERSFSRLEQILDKMNSGNVSLDDSLKLYEEADKLIVTCAGKLNAAESRIEMLIKKRSSELAIDEEGRPLKEPFQLLEVGSERE